MIQMRNSLLFILVFSYTLFLSGYFWDFVSLSLVFRSLIIMYRVIYFFQLLFGIHSASWIYTFLFFTKFRKYLALYFFEFGFSFFFQVLSLSLFWDSSETNISSSVIVTQVPQTRLLLFFCSLFSLCWLDWVNSIDLFSSSLILSVSSRLYYWAQLVSFYLLLYFSLL